MTNNELGELLRGLCALPAETEVVEFKEAKNGYDFAKLGKYFSALSNEANLKNKEFAWLVFSDFVLGTFFCERDDLYEFIFGRTRVKFGMFAVQRCLV